jgi:hypothetical protein
MLLEIFFLLLRQIILKIRRYGIANASVATYRITVPPHWRCGLDLRNHSKAGAPIRSTREPVEGSGALPS